VESKLVAHIGEVDSRRLFAREACSSMFTYCTEVLRLSEYEAYLRIAVARASRKHPMLLEMLFDGRLHLSGIAKLAPYLTEANRETVLARAARKIKREIEELIAELSPKPDAPARMRKLPEQRKEKPTQSGRLGPDRVAVPNSSPGQIKAKPTVVKPIAPARYKIELTASSELHDKLKRLQALMRSSVPDGDLATIIEEAVIEKLERLESERFGKTKAPRKACKRPMPHLPLAIFPLRSSVRCTGVTEAGAPSRTKPVVAAPKPSGSSFTTISPLDAEVAIVRKISV
jgi:hypothetical protein